MKKKDSVKIKINGHDIMAFFWGGGARRWIILAGISFLSEN